MRPLKLGKDNSPEIDTWKHAINFFKKNKEKVDYIVSVQQLLHFEKFQILIIV